MTTKSGKIYEKFEFKLSAVDRKKLAELIRRNDASTRVFRRTLVLRLLDQGHSVKSVAREIGISSVAVRNIGRRYLSRGLERALNDAPRPGKAPLIGTHQEKEIVALVCSSPPKERSRWTLKLLREEILRRKILKSVGKETIRTLLHESEVKPWVEKNVVHWGADRRIHPENGGHT